MELLLEESGTVLFLLVYIEQLLIQARIKLL